MALRRTKFAPGEWYHCYTRGVDGRVAFETPRDYERFLQSMYLCNSVESVRRDDMEPRSSADIFIYPRSGTLVEIGAYCLMPNHFHILIREKIENGIARFMQKMGTSYTMYFNTGRRRVGPLFVGPFRSKHVSDDRYFRRVAQYIHLNPVELFEPGWKSGAVTARRGLAVVERKLQAYPYSSLMDYHSTGKNKRLERAILDPGAFALLRDGLPSLASVLEDAALYYESLG